MRRYLAFAALALALPAGCFIASPSDEGGDDESTDTTAEASTTEAGDGDPTGDGDGDGDPCTVGTEGCPCTGGGGCDPGLVCDGDLCVPEPQPELYGACPNGDDSECEVGEICVVGNNSGVDWNLCTTPCADDSDCGDDPAGCGDLPGDGQLMDYCTPVLSCDFGNPCPMGMQCFPGLQQNSPAVCLWPA